MTLNETYLQTTPDPQEPIIDPNTPDIPEPEDDPYPVVDPPVDPEPGPFPAPPEPIPQYPPDVKYRGPC